MFERLFVQPVLASWGWWVSWSGIDRLNQRVRGNRLFQVFPCLISSCVKTEKTFRNHSLPRKSRFSPKYPSQSVRGWVHLNTLRFHNPYSRGRDAECAQSALGFPRRGTSGLWETGVAAFHISVLFVSLTQLSGRHIVCMWRHTPYHPSGRLLTSSSQTQGTGHSSNRVTHWFVLFTFTWMGDILLVNSK